MSNDLYYALLKAGLGYEEPNSEQITELVAGEDFRNFLEYDGSSTLGQLLHEAGRQDDDRSALIEIVLRRINEIVSEEKSNQNLFHASQKHILYGLNGALLYGHEENFRVLFAAVDSAAQQKELEETLKKISAWGVDEKDPQYKNLAEKAGLLFDVVMDKKAQREALLSAAKEGNFDVFSMLANKFSGSQTALDEALICAATGASNARRHVAVLLETENSEFEPQVLFNAAESAIVAGQAGALSVICVHMHQNCPDWLSRNTTDGTTLLVKAVRHVDDETAVKMAGILVKNRVFPDMDEEGNNPADILRARGLGDRQVVTAMEMLLQTALKLEQQRTLTSGFLKQLETEGGVSLQEILPTRLLANTLEPEKS